MSSAEEFCLKLAQSDSEEQVIEILREFEYWDDLSSWCDYGDMENNYSQAGNQQEYADAALVEKLINSNYKINIIGLQGKPLLAQRQENEISHDICALQETRSFRLGFERQCSTASPDHK